MADANINLTVSFPVYGLMAREENADGVAEFDEVAPQKGLPKRTISGKPAWVRRLPKVTKAWTPIVLENAIPIFSSEAILKMVVAEDKLTVKYGDLDTIALNSANEVSGFAAKAVGVDKVRLYLTARPPGSAQEQVATTEIPVSTFAPAPQVDPSK